ncbi:MAG: vitamin K epoxide reductase family protein [Gordonia sp. (in: high G+C Gram-positive bacteria)]|uniref:vitamin K epoxide reductase family protein n=1 Tax=Gordonia sp. (in: high G+C Gram-positive bacteria) TaxID=84139 RepID=UPI0039E3A46B
MSSKADAADPDVVETVAAEVDDVAERAAGEHRSPLTALRPIGTASAWVMLVCAVLGLIASFDLSIERIELLMNPDYIPSCNISPVLSCGSVMKTEQARFFGFPNPLIGLPAFAVIVTTAVLSVGRVRLPRWYWIGQTLGLTLGFVFINYLAFQSIFRIHALCPYCMVVWTVTPIVLVLSLSRALGDGLGAQKLRDASWVVLGAWYALVVFTIGVKFWYYWKTLF